MTAVIDSALYLLAIAMPTLIALGAVAALVAIAVILVKNRRSRRSEP